MRVKYHGVVARLERETDKAVLMDIAHADYGVIPGVFVPKSVLCSDSLSLIEQAGDGDDVEVFIQAWWFRKNYGEPKTCETMPSQGTTSKGTLRTTDSTVARSTESKVRVRKKPRHRT